MKDFNLTPDINNYQTKVTNKMRARVFRRAHWMVRTMQEVNFSVALKKCWDELRTYIENQKTKFEAECSKIRMVYVPNMHPNYSMQKAYDRGVKIY